MSVSVNHLGIFIGKIEKRKGKATLSLCTGKTSTDVLSP